MATWSGGAEDELPPKRMRLGTRSCAECRRKKIRCSFSENSSVCESCILHQVLCRPQQPQRPQSSQQLQRQQSRDKSQGSDEEEKVVLRQRLEELEGVVRQICGAIDIDADSATLAQFKSGTAEALKRIQQAKRPASESAGFSTPSSSVVSTHAATTLPGSVTLPSRSESTRHRHEDDADVDSFYDAPLLNMFKEARLIRNEGSSKLSRDSSGSSVSSAHPHSHDLVQGVLHLIPSHSDLVAIFEATEKYWALWPPIYVDSGAGVTEASHTLQQGGVAVALNLVSTGLPSGDPTTVAKILLWLALCLAQLPLGWYEQHPSLPAPLYVLKDNYTQTAHFLLGMAAEVGDTPDSVQTRMLQYRYYLDMGKPRKAWLSIRHCLNAALLLGLYRKKGSKDDPWGGLWPAIWQVERLLSCILGLSTAIPDYHPGLSRDMYGPTPSHRMLSELSRIIGSIIKRDQNPDGSTYADTVQMDQDWEQCKSIMPPEFWDDPVPPNTSFAALFFRQIAKLKYWITGQLIHIPYMHKSPTEHKFEISRMACRRSCREIIKAYAALRNSGPDVVMCELMDFEAFSAAGVLVVSQLLPGARIDSAVAENDLALVESVVRDMKRTRDVMDCKVPVQGSKLLELLLMIVRGQYVGPEKYDAFIPYFGRVKIGRAYMPETAAQSVAPAEVSRVGEVVPPPIFEFSAAEHFNFDMPFDFSSVDLELQGDWTMNVQPQDFHWVQAYDGQEIWNPQERR